MISTVKKEFDFCAAHRLPNHKGKCRFLHGHNYKLIVSITGEVNTETGMVVDFQEIKDAWNPLHDKYDHSTILAVYDPLIDSIGATDVPQKLNELLGEPTAENMALLIVTELKIDFPDHKVAVELFETPTSSVIYSECSQGRAESSD